MHAPRKNRSGRSPENSLLEKAHGFRGELTFVDHANRRGSLRIQSEGTYFRTAPHPFAMLPYGVIRYHGAPASLRDIPIGTVLHARGFLPPDPKLSSVPVLPVKNRNRQHGYSGKGVAPAENHLILLEDEPSFCQREGKIWKLQEVELQNLAGKIVARREPKIGGTKVEEETLTFDAATRIWRGREKLEVADLIADGIWPASGKKALKDQAVLLGITWKPTPSNIFTRFHIHPGYLAGRRRHATHLPQPDRDTQGLHSNALDARLDRCSRVWQVWNRHHHGHFVRRHG